MPSNLSNHSNQVIIKPWNIKTFENLPNFRFFPHSCKHCTYWESLDFDDKTKKEDTNQIKQKWLTLVNKAFGNCGFIAYMNDQSVGFIQYAPMKYFPRISKYQDFTPSRDTIFLTCLYIPDRDLRGKGIGKQLLETVTWDLKVRNYRSIETFARVRDTPSNDISDWLIRPLEFFIKMDFKIIKQKSEIAHLRKEF
ncbi:MAG: GNAT family N-acetyltransferase [Candidatus Hodarchaeota archaeon]